MADDSGSEEEETVYVYHIPITMEEGIRTPEYKPSVQGEQYLYHYGSNKLTVIQSKGYGNFHKDDIAVDVEEVPKSEVEESDNLIVDFA